jgi:tripartite-type tricarboxylate transporter receptor subunit TctC
MLAHAFARLVALIGALALCSGGEALAESFPTKAITLISTFPAGGTSDILSRILAQKLTSDLGQSVVVMNRPGAGGIVAAQAVATAKPDGYTLLMGYVGTHGINPSLYRKLPYDPLKDFSPISLVAKGDHVLVVPASSPIKSVRELIASAKERPTQLHLASSGNGSAPHLAGEMLAGTVGVKFVHVPYQGAPQAAQDLLAGRVDLFMPTIPVVLPLIHDGRLRALAVSGTSRSPALPNVPTLNESGLPSFEASSWYGVLGPANMPPAVVARLNAAINNALSLPDVKERYSGQGASPAGTTPEEFSALIKKEIAKWAVVVKTSGAMVE